MFKFPDPQRTCTSTCYYRIDTGGHCVYEMANIEHPKDNTPCPFYTSFLAKAQATESSFRRQADKRWDMISASEAPPKIRELVSCLSSTLFFPTSRKSPK